MPLTRADLSKPLNIEMQIPAKLRKKIIITPITKPTPIVAEVVMITATSTPAPVVLDVKALLGYKFLVLKAKKQSYLFGHGGCNKFQLGYQVEQSKIIFNQFIASSKYCDGLMVAEAYFLESLPKVTNWIVKDQGKSLYLYDDNKQLSLQFTSQ
ncbi:MAG: META domain-containing protein [Psychromonas sp.]|nr:META domain-containing protein [Alteromonadales bacterium]MCP5077489.1 META domain-containing protein [Psychromonas sp.]